MKISQKAIRIAEAIKLKKELEDKQILGARMHGAATNQVRDIIYRLEQRKKEILRKGYISIYGV